MVVLFILFLLELFLVEKRVICMFGGGVSFAGMFFNVITNLIIFLVLKRVVKVFSDL